MFSVGVIVPTFHYYFDPFKTQPLWELYFATIIDERLGEKDVNVDIIDLRISKDIDGGLTEDKIPRYAPERDLYIYWIAKTADYLEVLRIVKKLREVYTNSKHVAGGTHVENFPEECTKHFDATVVGPGEESFIKIINDCKKAKNKKLYQMDWKDVSYSDYPIARRSFLPKTAIVNSSLFEQHGDIKGTSAQFSRGCNFRCAYCAYNIPNFIQMRKPETIEEEINYLKDEYKVKGINLRDEICIPLNQKIAVPYIEAISRTNVLWRGQTKIGAKKEILELAYKSGCVELAVGVESVSQRVLDIVHKGQKLDQAKKFFKICHDLGIKTKMCLILGLPGEPQDIVRRTYDFIEETKPDYVAVSGLDPIPGSDMFNHPEKYGIKKIDKDWDKHFHLVFRFSDEEEFGLPFEYEEKSQWGKTFTRKEIIENIKEIQHYLQERRMIY